MQLTCKACGKDLHGRDVDLERLRARCRHCGWQFGPTGGPFRAPVLTDQGTDDVELAALPDRPDVPSNIVLTEPEDHGAQYFELAVKPLLAWTFPLVCLLLGVAVGVAAIATHLAAVAALPPLLMLVGYALLNQKTVRVYKNRLTISHQPLPRPGRKMIPAADIKQLYVDEVAPLTEDARMERRNDLSFRLYKLRVDVRGQRSPLTLFGHADCLLPLYVEKRIEEFLDITDEPGHRCV